MPRAPSHARLGARTRIAAALGLIARAGCASSAARARSICPRSADAIARTTSGSSGAALIQSGRGATGASLISALVVCLATASH